MKYPFRRFFRRNVFQTFFFSIRRRTAQKYFFAHRNIGVVFRFIIIFKTNYYLDCFVRKRYAGAVFIIFVSPIFIIIVFIPIVFIIISVVVVKLSVFFFIIRRYNFFYFRECQPRTFLIVYKLFIFCFHFFVNVFERFIDISENFGLIYYRVFQNWFYGAAHSVFDFLNI